MLPDARPDTAQAAVVVTKNYAWVFNGDARVMGAGEGSDSFEQRLGHEKNDGLWLLSDASFQSEHGTIANPFVITDQGGGRDPAFVVTPNFQAQAGDRLTFTAATDLASGDKGTDTFAAQVYRLQDDGWQLAATIANDAGIHTHTFDDAGEYRVKFAVNDETGQADKASATIDVGASPFFSEPVPLPDTVEITPATGSIVTNDILGDGTSGEHTWSFAGGEPQPDGSIVVPGDHGVLTVMPDGDYVYTPSGETSGTDTFTYTLTDLDGDRDDATLTIDVSHTIIDPLDDTAMPEPLPMAQADADAGGDASLASFAADHDGDAIPDALDSDGDGVPDALDLGPDPAPADASLAVDDTLGDAAGDDYAANPTPPDPPDLTILGLQLDAGAPSEVDLIEQLKDKANPHKDG